MITGPKNAHPTLQGWVSSRGELLKSQKISQIQIDEWNGAGVVSSIPAMLTEAPVGNRSLDDMSKAELLAMGQQYDITLSKYSSTNTLKTQLREVASDDDLVTFLLD
jgi:hypothetical protein